MIFVPADLFSPYIKGREMAIDRNWNDLNQSNKVEQGWLDNDARQLNNWFAQDTYGDRLASSNARGRIDQNSATGSDLNTQIAVAGQPGTLAQTQSASDYQVALRNATKPYIPQMADNNALFTYGQSVDRRAQGDAAIQTAPQYRMTTANNNVAAATHQGQVIQGQSDMFPLEQDVRRGDLTLRRDVNSQLTPDMLIPQKTMQNGTTEAAPQEQLSYMATADAANIAAQGKDIPIGSSRTLNVNGVPTTVSRDMNGLFVFGATGKQYIVPQAPTQAPAQGATQPTSVTSW